MIPAWFVSIMLSLSKFTKKTEADAVGYMF